MRLFLLMLIVTSLEVILIAKIGSAIGFFPTLFIIIFTAFLGARLLAQQWRFVMGKLQTLQGEPSEALLEALVLVICGVLLVTPGFLTDIIGFLGLVPALRAIFVRGLRLYGGNMVRGNFHFYRGNTGQSRGSQRQSSADNNVIEGEFERKDD